MSQDLAVVFAIETTVRELDSRLVLAALHARRGHRIFIVGGPAGQRMARELEGGVFVGKHVIHPTALNPQAYFAAKRNGFIVVHLAEEGGIFMGNEPDWMWDLDDQLIPSLLAPEDYVCTWGDFQRDYYRSKGAPNPENIRTTGHPRFDMYKTSLRRFYEDEAAALRKQHGNFVLWCSNFGLANDPEGPFNTFSKPLGYDPTDDETRRRFIGRWSHQSRTFAEFIELFHKLSLQRRDVNFIVRPHPSDNVDFFRYAFAGVDNVKVIAQGHVAPWLLAARAMLHDGCTTGLEAHLLGCPIVNFRPLVGTAHDYFLPNLFGTHTNTQAAAIEAVEASLDRPRDAQATGSADLPERAHKIFANFRHDSVDRFFTVLREAEGVARQRPRETNRRRLVVNEVRAIATEGSKQLLRRAFFRDRYRTALHNRQRFPGFDRAAIGKKLAKLRELTGNPLECRFYSSNILELTSTRPAE